MMNKKLILGSVFGLAALGLSSSALAYGGAYQEPADNGAGFYVGAQLGYVDTHWDNLDHNAFVCGHFKVDDDNGFGARPYVGYAFNHIFAVEFGYTYLDEADVHRFADHCKITDIENWALDVSLRLNAPIQDDFGLFARVGVAYLQSEDSLKWRAACFGKDTWCHSVESFNVTFGAGAYYDFTQNLRAEISWTRFEGHAEANNEYQPNPDFFSVGLSYRFPMDLFA